MNHPNLEIIERFFEAYGRRDPIALEQVLARDVQWTFPGQHPLAGTSAGIEAVVAFFDAMGRIMGSSNIQVEILVTGANDDYVAETQHIRTSRADGNNLEQTWCVLWRFADGKIVSGRHLASDQQTVDTFFGKLNS